MLPENTLVFQVASKIREAMNAFIEKENIKLGPQGTTPFVTEGNLPGDRATENLWESIGSG